ncbi:MAG: V-type ATPase 116kDa subunit family protein [Desulfurococcaceae archaeon TW002]
MALIVSVPERLYYIRLLIPKDLSNKVTNLLQSLGVMHVETSGELSEEDKEKLKNYAEKVRVFSNLVDVVESYYEFTVVDLKREVSLEDLDKVVNELYLKLSRVRQEIENLINNKKKLSDEISRCLKQVKALEVIKRVVGENLRVFELSFTGEALFSIVALGKTQDMEPLITSIPKDVVIKWGFVGDETVVFIVGVSSAWREVQELLSKTRAEIIEFPKQDSSISDYLSYLSKHIEGLRAALERTGKELEIILSDNLELLALAKVISDLVKSRLDFLLSAASGAYLLAVEGWVPEESLKTLEGRLGSEVGTYLVVKVSTDKKPPSKLKNPKPLKPFELLTKFYGLPSPGEWDPTPILTYSFLVFFGLMMADAVYGLILLLIIKYVLDRSRFIDNPYSPGYISLKKMLLMLSLSATIFGVLSNTFAGYSICFDGGRVTLVIASEAGSGLINIPALINLSDPMFFLILALIIGLIHINLGHALSVIIGVKARDLGRVLSGVGLIISEIFGIPYVLHEFLRYDLLPLSSGAYTYMLYTSLIGVLVMIVGTVKSLGGIGLFMWIFNITGLLGDVLSYSRIAGLGIATYVMAVNFNRLSFSVYEYFSGLAPLVGAVLGLVMMIVIAVFMNTFNLVFGAIGGFVHSMRLCFVEFLPKWYDGNGREFTPFTLKIEKHVALGKSI